MINFSVYFNKAQGYRVLVEFNDTIEFIGENYKTRVDCVRMINVIRKCAQQEDSYHPKKLSCGSWVFEFKNCMTNDIIGRSKTYTSEEDLQDKIKTMRVILPNAQFNSKTHSPQAS